MAMRFANRTIVVTGAASGIGLACVGAFLDEGASVVLADIDEESLAGVIEAMPREFAKRAVPVVCDVANARQVQALAGYAAENFGSLDAMVTAAGIVSRAHFPEVSEEDFDRVIRTNLKGTFLCVQAAARVMGELRDRGRDILGSIVMLSNDDAFSAIPHILPHVVAAGGIDRMAKSLARPLAGIGVRINAVGVGLADTGLLHKAVGSGKTAVNTGLARGVQGRAFDPDEIARIVLFLSGGEASAITGQTMGTGAD
jgi:NAD(P)-dependent dehydrogenase (short-subunit alcohol dehydrogenase family)